MKMKNSLFRLFHDRFPSLSLEICQLHINWTIEIGFVSILRRFERSITFAQCTGTEFEFEFPANRTSRRFSSCFQLLPNGPKVEFLAWMENAVGICSTHFVILLLECQPRNEITNVFSDNSRNVITHKPNACFN